MPGGLGLPVGAQAELLAPTWRMQITRRGRAQVQASRLKIPDLTANQDALPQEATSCQPRTNTCKNRDICGSRTSRQCCAELLS